MTPQERARMNELCARIQDEKNYDKFEQLTQEIIKLISAKESRFPETKFAPPGTLQKTVHANAVRALKSFPGLPELVEIRFPDAEPLYSEIRIANSFTDEHGKTAALNPPAAVEVKLQARRSARNADT